MCDKKYMPTLGELIDRLSIVQLKELLISEHKQEYAQEIEDIIHDIDIEITKNNVVIDAGFILAVITTVIMNREIWLNETNWRKGIREGNNLELTHGLNSIRNFCKNYIQNKIGGRKDYKLDNVEAFPTWIPEWTKKAGE